MFVFFVCFFQVNNVHQSFISYRGKAKREFNLWIKVNDYINLNVISVLLYRTKYKTYNK